MSKDAKGKLKDFEETANRLFMVMGMREADRLIAGMYERLFTLVAIQMINGDKDDSLKLLDEALGLVKDSEGDSYDFGLALRLKAVALVGQTKNEEALPYAFLARVILAKCKEQSPALEYRPFAARLIGIETKDWSSVFSALDAAFTEDRVDSIKNTIGDNRSNEILNKLQNEFQGSLADIRQKAITYLNL